MGSSGWDADAVLVAFEKQIGWCNALAAPFTAAVLTLLAEELGQEGPLTTMIGTWPGDPVADALALRLVGAFHALVLSGRDLDLAKCYPPEKNVDTPRLRLALQVAMSRHNGFIRQFVASPPQTNEVGRSAVLLGGFLSIAHSTRLPLRLLEIGASAGLNMIWDSYHYRFGKQCWGDPASPVRLTPEWSGPLPPLATPVSVAERSGCDIAPLDLTLADAQLRLRSYVWPDQPERLTRMEGAIRLASGRGIAVEHADAASWVADRLSRPMPGCATVLYHSIMWQYMPVQAQAALRATIEHAGSAATDEAPVTWLRFEPPTTNDRPELRLTYWPGGHEEHLATAHPHGSSVTWHPVH